MVNFTFEFLKNLEKQQNKELALCSLNTGLIYNSRIITIRDITEKLRKKGTSKQKCAHREARTHDPEIKSLVLYRLS